MANIKQQIKRIRISERQRLRNRSAKSEIKTFTRRFEDAVGATDKEAAETAMRATVKKLDRAAEKGIIHKNTAANRKSSLMKRFNKTFVPGE